jgi:hypothetical protein
MPLSSEYDDGEILDSSDLHAIHPVWYVTDPGFGATGDGSTDDTTAIQNCIDAADAAGGGVVIFPIPSVSYSHSALTLYDGVRLHYITLGTPEGSLTGKDGDTAIRVDGLSVLWVKRGSNSTDGWVPALGNVAHWTNQLSGFALTGTNTETDLFDLTIPGGTLDEDRGKISGRIHWVMNVISHTAGTDLTIRLYVGASTIIEHTFDASELGDDFDRRFDLEIELYQTISGFVCILWKVLISRSDNAATMWNFLGWTELDLALEDPSTDLDFRFSFQFSDTDDGTWRISLASYTLDYARGS